MTSRTDHERDKGGSCWDGTIAVPIGALVAIAVVLVFGSFGVTGSDGGYGPASDLGGHRVSQQQPV